MKKSFKEVPAGLPDYNGPASRARFSRDRWAQRTSGASEADLGLRRPEAGDKQGQGESRDEQYGARRAPNYIQNGYFREGLNVLDRSKTERARGITTALFGNYKVGNNAVALEHAKAGLRFEPNNFLILRKPA